MRDIRTHKTLRRQAPALERLIELAELFGYDVVFSRTKEMRDGNIEGLMCPDLERIYVSPNSSATETLAHEIGHAVLEHLMLSDKSTNEGEQLADAIGWVMCRWIRVAAKELHVGAAEIIGED